MLLTISYEYDYGMSGEQPSGEPSEVLGYLLKHALQRLVARADDALGPLGVDRKEFGVLRMLDDGPPLSQQELATRLAVDPTTMVAVIDALEAKGALTRRPDPADRRRNAIELTASGRTTCRAAAAAYAAAEEEFLAPLGRAEAERFREALRTLLARG